ncbi:solute carrier family 22 member 15-like [Anneissia japonica]|uniref:solute carrier family 22 member 15-like n=1 Tax=Anneissia japonica TaxID=1529436 RepID=UPI001425658F|nr:solute carrier family 22 member 15-like [Anneissia japonica]XP_033120476.1 solute carrier family 22 member 15-like [Anneissia japonica]XP_033120477.1 solute carrier family 22 member 15-like [Anneissia japonica]XP_033120478.1 solute carrier family 22 member 15-like [Anneissia japonica]XP_033120479.1 solute carrier family 22 member 15-like [Anneissia japonica]
MDFDAVLQKVGTFGKAQKLYTFLVSWMSVWAASVTFNHVFAAREPQFTCEGFENLTKTEICDLDVPCNHIFNLSEFSSMVADLDLVCERSMYVTYGTSIFFLGVLVGVFTMGVLADKFGRQKVMSFGIILFVIVSASVCAIHDVWQLFLLRFLCGYLGGGTGVVSYVLLTEVIGPDCREAIGFIFNSAFSVGFAVYALFAYLIYNWRLLTVVSMAPVLICLSNICLIPESPRWLASNGQLSQAESILYRIGKTNGKKIEKSSISLKLVSETKKTQNSVFDLVRTKVMRKRILIQWINWFTCSMVYYGMSLSSATLGGNPYVSFAVSGLIEIPANYFAYVLMRRWGRKPCMLLSYFLGGFGCVGLLIIQPDDDNKKVALTRTVFAMIGKFGISSAFTAIYVYSVELIPTVVRNSGMGTCSMVARIGGIIAPELDTMGNAAMYVMYGAACFLTGFLDFFLPETLNKSLPEHIAEIEGIAYKLVAQDSGEEDAQVFSDANSADLDWDIGTGMLERQTDIDGLLGENTILSFRYGKSNDNERTWEVPVGGKENGIEMTSLKVYEYVDDEVEILFDRSNTL